MRLPFTPKWSASLESQFVQPLAQDLRLTINAAARHRSSVWIDTSYAPLTGKQPGVTKIDARIELAAPDAHWALALVGTNLTNKLTAGQSFVWPLETLPGGAAVAGVFIDEGRTVSLQGRLDF